MKRDPNSDSKQCTDQNWVECTVHTPMAHAASALRPYRAHSTVSWHSLAPCGGRARPCRCSHWPCRAATLLCHLPLWSRYKNCIATQTSTARPTRLVARFAARIVAFLRRVVGCCYAVSQPLARRVQTSGLPLLSRHTPLAKPWARVLTHALTRRSAMSWLCWPCRRTASRIVAPCCTPLPIFVYIYIYTYILFIYLFSCVQ